MMQNLRKFSIARLLDSWLNIKGWILDVFPIEMSSLFQFLGDIG